MTAGKRLIFAPPTAGCSCGAFFRLSDPGAPGQGNGPEEDSRHVQKPSDRIR